MINSPYMAKVIIGIHGLSNKPPKQLLEQWWKLAMAEGLEKHNFRQTLPVFEMVYWADLMNDSPLDETEKNPESPYFLEEGYSESPGSFPIENHETRIKVVDFLGHQLNKIFLNEDFSMNYSFISDAIVSRYFREMQVYYEEDGAGGESSENNFKAEVRERLYKVLVKYKKDEIMLIGHSMGSIISFDVLSFIKPQINIQTFITIGSPLGLPVVIGKIANEQKQEFGKKYTIATPRAIRKNWFNFADILDKVAFNYRLSDDFSENSSGIKPIDFLVVNDYEVNSTRNPHKSFGYLRTQEFSNVLNDFILSKRPGLWQRILGKVVSVFPMAGTNKRKNREKQG